MKKIIKICEHSRLCRIAPPPEEETSIMEKLTWVHYRFGDALSKELMSSAMDSIIKAFDKGLKGRTLFEFILIVRAEKEDK
jgi:hypothetical protein